ncbi:putative tripeptidyl-peptidase II [Helianthus annuus]|nr:putative tripeptidyl-peptidase II [Helianthus annuus]
MIYSYNKQFNGFAALLDEEDAAKLAEHPDVALVIQNKGIKLHTTHSWDFLQLENNGVVGLYSLWTRAKFGENIIIANLDTGVWPESKSFSDNGYGPIPTKWKGGCHNETLVPCNNGVRMGTAKGGSPRARVAAYKVCWPIPPTFLKYECNAADIVKGFETAIYDGVDVISASLGAPPTDYMNDALAIASFHAVKRGVTVVFSAGNDGPSPGSVFNVAPWVITVGASTTDRDFQSFVHLASGLDLKGLSMPNPIPRNGLYPLVNAANAKAENATSMDAMFCAQGALDPEKVQGKILVCLRGGNIERADKGAEAARAGAAGMILCNDKAYGDDITAELQLLPAIHITYADGLRLYAYLNSTK